MSPSPAIGRWRASVIAKRRLKPRVKPPAPLTQKNSVQPISKRASLGNRRPTVCSEKNCACQEEIAAPERALADARRDFADELENCVSHEQNEQRLAAAEKRALMEIESERVAASRARRELQAANERTASLEAEHRSERDALRDALATAKAELAASAARCSVSDAQIVEKDALLAERLAASDLLRQRVETISLQLEAARADAAHGRPHLVRRARAKKDLQGRASIDFSGGPFVRRLPNQKP